MSKEAFLAKLAEVFDVDKIGDDFSFEDRWDSLVVLSAIAAIDEEFGVTVAVKQLTEAKTIQDVFDLIERSGVNR